MSTRSVRAVVTIREPASRPDQPPRRVSRPLSECPWESIRPVDRRESRPSPASWGTNRPPLRVTARAGSCSRPGASARSCRLSASVRWLGAPARTDGAQQSGRLTTPVSVSSCTRRPFEHPAARRTNDYSDSMQDWSPQIAPRFNRLLRSIHYARNNHCHRESAVRRGVLKVRCERMIPHGPKNRHYPFIGSFPNPLASATAPRPLNSTSGEMDWRHRAVSCSELTIAPIERIIPAGRNDHSTRRTASARLPMRVMRQAAGPSGCDRRGSVRRGDHNGSSVGIVGEMGTDPRSVSEQASLGHHLIFVHLLEDQAAQGDNFFARCNAQMIQRW